MLFEFLKLMHDRINEKLKEMSPGVKPITSLPGDFVPPKPPVRNVTVPDGVEEIPRSALRRRVDIVAVSVPPSVKTIGETAFEDCTSLEKVTLSEGLEKIEDNAFSGCKNLKSIVIPDSVKKPDGRIFYRSGIKEPVLSASGETLIFCPAEAAGREYTVPDGVRRIASHAFNGLTELKKIHLPRTLERICKFAFCNCGITSVTFPRWLEEVEINAFYKCDSLKDISFHGEDELSNAVLRAHARGKTFLRPGYAPPKEETYWKSAEFKALARKCAEGGFEAMERMVSFFEEKSKAAPDILFYSGAANFWRYRAWKNGSKEQQKWLENYVKTSHDEALPSACLSEMLEGALNGSSLNALGFLFFDPDRFFTLAGIDDKGVVEVCSYESEDGPDEDGFGRETYFDWWYLDENLCPAPGAELLHSYSSIDRRISTVKRRFEKAYDDVIKAGVPNNIRLGLQLEQDDLLEAAYSRYKRAADAGNGDAMFAVGNLYLHKNFRGLNNPFAGVMMPWNDIPTSPDMRSAYLWFLKAAKDGNVNAESNVGVMLCSGVGCKKDIGQGRAWLKKAAGAGSSYAAKALHDFFDVPIADVMPDEDYDRIIGEFCAAVNDPDVLKTHSLYEKLMCGTDMQLSRFGLRLAEERYVSGGEFWKYGYPNLNKERSCAPVVSFRCGWASAVIVNLRAFPNENVAVTFASDIGDNTVPACGIRKSNDRLEYDASEFGWLNKRRHACVLRSSPGYINNNVEEELKYCGVNVKELLESLKLSEHEALFFETGEKEYSAEIGYLADGAGDLRVLLRYTIGGWDEGDRPAEVREVSCLSEPRAFS